MFFSIDQKSFIVLFRFSPNLSVSIGINVDVDGIRSAADGTVLDILLGDAAARIERDAAALATVGTGDLGLEVGHPVAEGEILIEGIGGVGGVRKIDHRFSRQMV